MIVNLYFLDDNNIEAATAWKTKIFHSGSIV